MMRLAWVWLFVAGARCQEEAPTTCASLLGFKLAATGSTWFAETVQRVPGVILVEELFTSGSKQSVKQREATMAQKLRCDATSDVVGFTINVKNSPGVDWGRVVKKAGASVVLWDRTNVVKLAISQMRKMIGVCGGANNLRTAPNKCTARVDDFPLRRFDLVLLMTCKNRATLDEAFRAASSVTNRTLTLTYEAMAQDERAVLMRLFAFLGKEKKLRLAALASAVKEEDRPSTYKKTSADLRDVVRNYDEIDAHLKTLTSAACPVLDMFRDTTDQPFERCDCADLTRRLNKALVKGAKAGKKETIKDLRAAHNKLFATTVTKDKDRR